MVLFCCLLWNWLCGPWILRFLCVFFFRLRLLSSSFSLHTMQPGELWSGLWKSKQINEQRTTITLSTFIKFHSWPLTLTDREFPFYTWKFIILFFSFRSFRLIVMAWPIEFFKLDVVNLVWRSTSLLVDRITQRWIWFNFYQPIFYWTTFDWCRAFWTFKRSLFQYAVKLLMVEEFDSFNERLTTHETAAGTRMPSGPIHEFISFPASEACKSIRP